MKAALGGGTLKNDVAHMEREEETRVYVGDQQFYYPKKLCCKGDPALERGALQQEAMAKQKRISQDLDERIRKSPLAQPFPDQGTFGAALYEQKQQLYLQSPDTVLYLSQIYAINKVLEEKAAVPGAEKSAQQIDAADREKIDALSKKVLPSMSSLLSKSMGKVNLPMLACQDDPATFVSLVDGFKLDRHNSANQDLTERKNVISESLNMLRGTGAGRNYFGVERSGNSEEYDDLVRELGEYQQKLEAGTADGFDEHNLTQKGLKYISDKLKTRSTTTGVQRFDSTMRMLHQLMPAKEFQALCNRINRSRGVASNPFDKEYVSPLRYAPQTPACIAATRAEVLKAVPSMDPAENLSEILAAHRIAAERDPQRGMKAEVIRPEHEKEDKKHLADVAKVIRRSPEFRQLINGLSNKPAVKARQVAQLTANGGEKLEQSLNNIRQPQQEPGIS